jgi:16S rRNA (cytidine1402-2'-O)-methyltransferase
VKNTGKTTTAGLLIMASNHIGRPEDIPPRALIALKEADLVIFEEDKPARQTLKAAGIHRDYLKFNEHHQQDSLEEATEALKKGSTVIYMSDQGSPALADPGRHLNKIAFSCGAKVQVIPGPSSVTAALSAAPFDTNRFRYVGFPPREPDKRDKFFSKEISSGDCVVLMDTPYRLKALVESLAKSHPAGKALIAIDITGEKEQYHYGPFKKLAIDVPGEKLNFVMVIQGSEKKAEITPKGKGVHKRKRR